MSTPPPQGNPFAQGQNPYAQAPQGQAPYPQQPGAPGVPPQGAAPFAPMPPEQPRRKVSFKTVKNILVGVGIVTAIIVGVITGLNDADKAEVGDCLKSASSSSDEMEVVDCTSSEAEAKVLKKIDGTYTSFTAETECRKVSGATSFYAQTGDGDNFLLCLRDA
ncbi:hypothetical protein ABZ869_17250 [Streptomyces sp. NPDC046928]|uniref:LppU/SCO3897 family protein n=1 Tax=Streptomyces sp. NPDC046928 TaxID=3155021 RepID=UPI0033DC3D42